MSTLTPQATTQWNKWTHLKGDPSAQVPPNLYRQQYWIPACVFFLLFARRNVECGTLDRNSCPVASSFWPLAFDLQFLERSPPPPPPQKKTKKQMIKERKPTHTHPTIKHTYKKEQPTRNVKEGRHRQGWLAMAIPRPPDLTESCRTSPPHILTVAWCCACYPASRTDATGQYLNHAASQTQ